MSSRSFLPRAASPTRLAAPVTAFSAALRRRSRFRSALPLPDGSSDDAWRLATPATYITSFPPTVLHHGLADITIPPESSQEFLSLLRHADVPAELHTFAGVPHEFVMYPEFAEATARLNDTFLERYILNPRTYPPFGGGRGGAGQARP